MKGLFNLVMVDWDLSVHAMKMIYFDPFVFLFRKGKDGFVFSFEREKERMLESTLVEVLIFMIECVYEN